MSKHEPPKRHDPVTELYKSGIDRSLLRENLRLSPAERLANLQKLMQGLTEVREAGRRLRLRLSP